MEGETTRRLAQQAMRLQPAVLILMCFFASLGIAQTRNAPQISAGRIKEENDIREAVFRYRISMTAYKTIFLGVDGNDPADQFMARFSKSAVSIKKASQALFRR